MTFQLGSQTLCKRLEAGHDDPSKDFFDDGQKTEISISAGGRFLWDEKDGELAGISSLKLVYSKQPIIGLTQELRWVGACVRGYISKQLSYRDEVRDRSVIVNE